MFRVTYAKRAKFKWEQFDYPPYSPDMSPCDFQVFGPLKKHLKEQRPNSDDELKNAVKDWVSSRPQIEESIDSLINGIVVLRPMMHTLNKVFLFTHSVASYLFV